MTTPSITTRKHVLLTGASGRIGRAIAPALSQRFALRLFDKNASEDIPDLLIGDLSRPEDTKPILKGVDTLIHLAAQSTEADFVSVLVPNNVVGLHYLFENAVEAGVKRIVFASTIQAFGNHPHEQIIHETDLPRPTTLYGATKAFGETMGRWYRDKYGIEFLAVRIGWFLKPDDEQDRNLLRTQPGARSLWLSPRDAVQIFEKSVDAATIGSDGYGIIHATSRPLIERMSLTSAKALLGYEPIDDIRQFAQGSAS